MTDDELEALSGFDECPSSEALLRAANDFRNQFSRRRSVRSFSSRHIDRQVIELCLQAALGSPSGANQQPWHFVAVSSLATKHRIREAAEAEEREFYSGRAPQAWLDALAPIGTDADKPFLEIAPWLIAIFAEAYGIDEQGQTVKNYYVSESVGIATGVLITALNQCGLATLTHTPSPMRFLNEILGRPKNERPYILLVVGHPAENATVPKLTKKTLATGATFIE